MFSTASHRLICFRLVFASHDIDQLLRARLLCPKTLRPSKSPLLHLIAKRSAPEPIDTSDDDLDEELDDFYVFW